jgi:hypothetical protein
VLHCTEASSNDFSGVRWDVVLCWDKMLQWVGKMYTKTGMICIMPKYKLRPIQRYKIHKILIITHKVMNYERFELKWVLKTRLRTRLANESLFESGVLTRKISKVKFYVCSFTERTPWTRLWTRLANESLFESCVPNGNFSKVNWAVPE